MEFVFASHSFDVWESWTFEGSLEECRLVNCRNPSVSSTENVTSSDNIKIFKSNNVWKLQAVLDVRVEILATVGDEDGITRWLD